MGPVELVPDDPLPERDCLARSANALARADDGVVRHSPGAWVKRIERADGIFRVQLIGEHKQEFEVERVIANVGHHPDHALSAELRMAWCESSDVPGTFAASLDSGPESLISSQARLLCIGCQEQRPPFGISLL